MRSLRFLFVACLFMSSTVNAQNVFRSVQSGDWDDASTWFAGAGPGGTEGINYPSASDSIYILHDVDIVTANSGSDFVISGYLNVAAGVKLQCEVGTSSNGLSINDNGVVHLFGTLFTAAAGEVPATGSPVAKEFTCQDNSTFIAFSGSFLFVSDDWEIEGNAEIYIEDNVCLRVDDDVNFNGTGWTMCGDGDISIGGDGVNSNVSFGGGSSNAQICSGTSIIRNTVSTDCSSGTVITTGTGASGAAPTAVDDAIITEINTGVEIPVLTSGVADSDPSLDTLQIRQIGNNAAINDNTTAQGGTISINDNGTPTDFTDDFIDYFPPIGYEGEDTFQYIIEDEEGLTDTATVTISVINCGNSYVDLIGVGANGATTATLTFTDTTNIDSIRLDLVYKNGKPSFATFVSSAGESNSGTQIDAINIAGDDDGVYRTTINSASSVTVTHDNSGGVRSFLAYVYRRGVISAITSVADDQVVYLFQNSFSFTQEIPAGTTPRDIRIQMPISELNEDSRSALLEVTAGPVSGSLETFTQDLGNSLKIFTLVLKDVPGDVTELDVTVTSKTGGAGDSFVTAGISFGIQCSGESIEAVPDNVSTPENTAVTIDILDNDLQGSGAIDTARITNIGVLDPQNGSVTINSLGQAVYTPDPGFTGVDYFQYEVCDTLQLCDITTVTVSVTCATGNFVEVAETVGLDLGGNKDGGLSWADFNDDGLIDVIVNTNNGTNDTRIYFAQENSGVISFTDVTSTNASGLLDDTKERSVVTGDLNNDGYTDFARNEFNGTGIEIWFNRGPGSSPAYSFGDGAQDPNVEIGSFSTSNTVFNTEGMTFADWNQDGWLDIIVENDGGGIEVLENNKDGTFSEIAHATTGFPIGSGGSGTGDYMTVIDYDNDGFVDAMARRASEDDLYRFNSGTNQFDAVATPDLATNNSEKGAITFCDVDNDADFDIIWAHQSDDNNTSIYLQNDDGTFSFGTNLVNDGGIEECDCADVDNDGDNDIFLGDDGGDSYLFKNNTVKGGALSFTQDNSCIAPGADVEGSEFVDYDNDGDMDLYMNINGGDNQLWQNGQDDNNFLLVEPRIDLGSGRSRSAIGANVMLIENCVDTCQIRDVSGGRGHGSQKPEVVHFGLPNGPSKSYKIVVFYVHKDGSRTTVIKSVTPSNLTNQKIVILDTDDNYDLCLDADNDGILNIDDIDDDNDGVLDVDEACPTYPIVVTSQSGVGNSGSITGAPDGAFAEIHTDGDVIVVDFGSIQPAGTEYILTWRERTGQSGTAEPIIEESEDNVTYTINSITPTTNSTTAVSTLITSQNSFRYLRISKDTPPSQTDFEIDAIALNTCTDTDGDGVANSVDLDSDQDGVPDIVEAGGVDADSDGRVDGVFTDSDGDGWSNTFDPDPGQGGTVLDDPDTDGDGLNDRIDLDSDNDGIQDLIEAGGVDFDKDGILIGNDSDGDGLFDSIDSDNGGEALANPDTDNDGNDDRTDLDSDGDGIGDITEAGGEDTNGDGVVDGVFADTDGDGWSNTFDSDDGGSPLIDVDSDEDGKGNRIDIDSDDDGIIDIIESQPSGVLIAPSGNDADSDGIDDNFDPDSGNTLTTPENTDGEDNPDYLDTDSDNDGDLDILEGWDTDNNGVANVTPTFMDSDGDGLDNAFDNITGPNNTTNVTNNGQESNDFPNLDKTLTDERDWRESRDNDNDGIVDDIDLDDDNDGIPDSEELDCTSGVADAITLDAGVSLVTNALGIYDGAAAQVSTSDILTLDLTDTVPEGATIRLRMRRDNNNRVLVEGSVDNSTYTNGVTYGNTAADVDMPDLSVFYFLNYEAGSGGVRFVRFTQEVGPTSIDAVSYTPQCPVVDTDGDGIEDQFDLDSDNDGIPDIIEAGGEDTDGNGLVDDINANGTLTADTDGDGLADLYDANNSGTAITHPDTDGDGLNDSQDLDADNDGIPDVVEVGGTDVNGDGKADGYADTDNDGFNDEVDGDVGQDGTSENSADALLLTGADTDNDGVPNSIPSGDQDGDGIRNHLDLDADNDGIADVVEVGGTDVNGDGRADDYVDADSDGFNDVVDGDPTNALTTGDDSNGANTADALTLTGSDTDNDGNPNSFPNDDLDGDNVYNFLDLDSDDDGILDVTEAGGTDADRDGIEDSFTDADTDGFNDNVDGDPDNSLAVGSDATDSNLAGVTVATGDDTDGDGAPNSFPNDDFDGDNLYNFIDIDADNDGIVDNTEGQSTAGYVAPANADDDGDGIDNAYDDDDANFGGAGAVGYELSDIDALLDIDSPDYLDINSDNDGEDDAIEGHDSDGDGTADGSSPANTGVSGGATDVDGDGLLDGYDNNTASTDPTNTNLQGTSHPDADGFNAERDWREFLCVDSDNDGICNDVDNDDDNDGIPDGEEDACGNTTTLGIANSTTATAFDGDLVLGVNSFTGFTTSDGIAYDVIVTTSIETTSPTVGNGITGDATIDGYRGIGITGERVVIRFENTATGDPVGLSGFDFRISDFEDAGGFEENIPVFSYRTIDGNRRTFGNGDWTGWEDASGVAFGTGGSQLTTNADGDLITTYAGAGGSQNGKFARLNVPSEYITEITVSQHNVGGGCFFGWASTSLGSVCDTDNDGIANYLDLDSDNDGIPDIVEAGGEDTDGNGLVDNINANGTLTTDTDGDGLDDLYDSNNGGTAIANADQDGDGIPNAQDLDADDDGIPDVVESGGTDVNGDGRADDYVDTDNDGFNDVLDGDVGQDGTSENSANALILTGADTDSDGVPNSFPNQDFDGDNVYNYLDLDADDDGILDVMEAGGTDIDRDGREDNFVDADGDGFNDLVDGDPDNSLVAGDDSNDSNIGNVTLATGDDTNGDGVPNSFPNDDFDGDNLYNFLDIDADNDGITDNTEGQGTSVYVAPSNLDSDGDGIDNAYDSDDAAFAGAGSSFIPSDVDQFRDPDSPDYLDLDSDQDGETDAIEGHDADGDGTADGGSPARNGLSGGSTDIDNDGLLDGFDNNTSSTDPTNTTLQGTSHPNADGNLSERDWREFNCVDSDNDGICDTDDLDDDNDGLLDTDENTCSNTETLTFGDNTTASTIDGDLSLGVNTFTGFTTSDGTPYNVIITTSVENLSISQGDGASGDFIVDAYVALAINGERFNVRFEHAVTGNPVGLSGFDFRVSDLESDGTFLESLYMFSYRAVDGTIVNYGNGYWEGWQDASGVAFGAGGADIGTDNSGNLTTTYVGEAGTQSSKFVQLDVSSVLITEFEVAQHNNNGGSFFGWNSSSLSGACDKDQDGTIDQLDLDSDGDGIADIIEAGGADTDNNGIVDGVFSDSDNDGWSGVHDTNDGGTALADGDQDSDGIPNRCDLDSDDDGLQDAIESGGTDADGDGLEDGAGLITPTDTDGDGTLPNYLDLDSDNDGIIDNIEWQTTINHDEPSGTDADNNGWDDEYDGNGEAISNNDGNGASDYIDTDADDDGQPDWQEGFDDDEDEDALLDLIARANAYETAAGNPNHYVVSDDGDGDGIPDFLEDAGGLPAFLTPGNPLYRDDDGDGLVNLYDSDNNGSASNIPGVLSNVDSDGEPDFRDSDNNVTLPIQLVHFTATQVGERVQLDWQTQTEINNDYFTIERSVDGVEFEEVLQQEGAGNSSRKLDYRRFDESPQAGYNYYRLKQTDYDGRSESFNIEVVYFGGISTTATEEGNAMKLYPNPSEGKEIYLAIDKIAAGRCSIEILNQFGQLISQQELNLEEAQVNYKLELLRGIQLASGTYHVRIINETSQEVLPLIIQ